MTMKMDWSQLHHFNTDIAYFHVSDGSTKLLPSISRLHPAKCAEIGVFSLGSPAADLQALRYIRNRYSARSDDVVVSGSGLPVFAAVARLLRAGMSPTRITVVVREEEGRVEGLNEKNVSRKFVLYIRAPC